MLAMTGWVGGGHCNTGKEAFRPVVVLKNSVRLKENSDGYEIN